MLTPPDCAQSITTPVVQYHDQYRKTNSNGGWGGGRRGGGSFFVWCITGHPNPPTGKLGLVAVVGMYTYYHFFKRAACCRHLERNLLVIVLNKSMVVNYVKGALLNGPKG